jgi:hypothetical protein
MKSTNPNYKNWGRTSAFIVPSSPGSKKQLFKKKISFKGN